ncbi:unnamed protein product [Caenorhabditis angaria]|uniref:MULE transposase domain-containing protein n=1 Tax=Caenorhabditis angaria TaxID=860376 RepID=A0A9P1IRY2_9PELO|nr:unnamed protein product [Caenorhabditis angaria]
MLILSLALAVNSIGLAVGFFATPDIDVKVYPTCRLDTNWCFMVFLLEYDGGLGTFFSDYDFVGGLGRFCSSHKKTASVGIRHNCTETGNVHDHVIYEEDVLKSKPKIAFTVKPDITGQGMSYEKDTWKAWIRTKFGALDIKGFEDGDFSFDTYNLEALKGDRSLMIRVPTSERKLRQWSLKFGEGFKERISKCSMVCVDCDAKCSGNKNNSLRIRTPNRSSHSSHGLSSYKEEQLAESDESCGNEDDDKNQDPDFIPPEPCTTSIEYLICDMRNVLPYIRKCYKCLEKGVHSDASISIDTQGATVKAKLVCFRCAHAWNWCSSIAIDENRPGRKQQCLNLDIATAIVVSGNGISFGCCHICGDGQFDSRGYSACYCRYTIQDIRTKLILTMVVSRKERGGSSPNLENIGHLEAMNKLIVKLENLGFKDAIGSFTSDRCSSMEKQMALHFPKIAHVFDMWHFIRSIVMEIKMRIHQKQFAAMKPWCRDMINHLYHVITNSNGDGQRTYEHLSSFFHHCTDRHEQFTKLEGAKDTKAAKSGKNVAKNGKEVAKCGKGDSNFEKFKKCQHPPVRTANAPPYLNLAKPSDKKAWELMKDIIMTPKRSKDIGKVSSHCSTSALESFHSIATKYAPKHKYYSKSSHEIRSKIAAIDWNCKQLDEMNGLRPVIGRKKVFCKTKQEEVFKKLKAPASMTWRREIRDAVRTTSLVDLKAMPEIQYSTESEYEESDVSENEADENLSHNHKIGMSLQLLDDPEKSDSELDSESED